MRWRPAPASRCPECSRVVRITDTLTAAQWSDIDCPRCGTKLIYTPVSRNLAALLLVTPGLVATPVGLVGIEFTRASGGEAWLAVGLVVLILGPSLAGLWFGFPYFHAVTRWYPRCKRCGYDLRGTDGSTCPECGVDITRIDGVK